MIALVCLNQKDAYNAMLQGWPSEKESLPRDRVSNIVVQLDGEELLFKCLNPNKIINLLPCPLACSFEEALVIVTFYDIRKIFQDEIFLYLIEKVLVHRNVSEIIL